MNGSIFYGLKGRVISGIAGFAGALAAFVAAAQAAGLFSLFSERLQGGASKPEVRAAAATSDDKNALEELNK